MAITRAQQARQMLEDGGMTKKIKGQKHMLAYITPGEAKTLENLGGQKTMTPEGIPAYPPPGPGGQGPGGSSGGRGGDRTGGGDKDRGPGADRNPQNPNEDRAKEEARAEKVKQEREKREKREGERELEKFKRIEKQKKARDKARSGPDNEPNPGDTDTFNPDYTGPDYGFVISQPPSPFEGPGFDDDQDEDIDFDDDQDEDIDEKKKKSFKDIIERFNKKRRKKNLEYIQNLRNKKFKGIMDQYNLTEEQLNTLLEGEDEFQGGRNLTFAGLQQLLDMDPSARKLGEDFNEDLMQGKLGALEMSPRMKKGVGLSKAELFSTTDPTTRIDLPGVLGILQGEENFSNLLSGLNRLETLDTIADTPGGVPQSEIDNYFNLTMGKGGTDPITGETVDALFTPIGDRGPGAGNNPILPIIPTDPVTDPVDPRSNFYGLSPRIGGSMFDFSGLADGGRVAAMDGGIMDIARQGLFLGGITKGIKKGLKSVTRGLKKVIKSPIGKAALLGAVGYGLGGGTFFGKMLPGVTRGGQGFGGFGGLSSIFGNVGDIIGGKGLGDAFAKFGGNKALTGILGASILPLLFGKKEDEFDIDAYYAANRLNRNAQLYNRIAGSEFSFAEGGEVEPVAKKTMPLLDMGGQEMDLRAEGGFVPIGRMEKADDVPARLSKNEFVFTAEAVRNAGEGDVDKGAEVMYNMMKNLESGGEVSEESQGLEGAREMFKTSQRLGEVI